MSNKISQPAVQCSADCPVGIFFHRIKKLCFLLRYWPSVLIAMPWEYFVNSTDYSRQFPSLSLYHVLFCFVLLQRLAFLLFSTWSEDQLIWHPRGCLCQRKHVSSPCEVLRSERRTCLYPLPRHSQATNTHAETLHQHFTLLHDTYVIQTQGSKYLQAFFPQSIITIFSRKIISNDWFKWIMP